MLKKSNSLSQSRLGRLTRISGGLNKGSELGYPHSQLLQILVLAANISIHK